MRSGHHAKGGHDTFRRQSGLHALDLQVVRVLHLVTLVYYSTAPWGRSENADDAHFILELTAVSREEGRRYSGGGVVIQHCFRTFLVGDVQLLYPLIFEVVESPLADHHGDAWPRAEAGWHEQVAELDLVNALPSQAVVHEDNPPSPPTLPALLVLPRCSDHACRYGSRVKTMLRRDKQAFRQSFYHRAPF